MLHTPDEIAICRIGLEHHGSATRAAHVHHDVDAVPVQKSTGRRQKRRRRLPLREALEFFRVGDEILLHLVQVLPDGSESRELLAQLLDELVDGLCGHIADELLLGNPRLSFELSHLSQGRIQPTVKHLPRSLDLLLHRFQEAPRTPRS